MDVVVPLRRVERHGAIRVARQQVAVIVLVFDDEVDVAVAGAFAHAAGKLDQQMFAIVVLDRVDGIEPQTVDPELGDPGDGVLDDEIAHGLGVVAS